MRHVTLRKTVWLTTLCALACSLAFAGCGTRTIYIAPGDPVRLRETIPQAAVWVRDSQGSWTAGQVDLPEGWYALPDPGK